MRIPILNRTLSLAAVLVAVFLAGCDMPIDPGTHPVGAVFLRADGSEAARFQFGLGASGQLRVNRGQTATFRLRLIDGNGNLVPVDGVEYRIRNPAAIISLAVDVGLQGADQIVVTGRQAFSTTLVMDVYHGNHLEFQVRDVPVVVQ
jgi:hypothetical protein